MRGGDISSSLVGEDPGDILEDTDSSHSLIPSLEYCSSSLSSSEALPYVIFSLGLESFVVLIKVMLLSNDKLSFSNLLFLLYSSSREP